MKRRILLPTDFSKNSWHAIKYALELYKNDTCNFYLLNVFYATGNIMESIARLEPGSELYEAAKSESQKGLNKIIELLNVQGHNNTNHHIEAISIFNSPLQAIKNIVETKDIEMIVMGTKGAGSSKEVAYGSTAIYVMEKVRNCPVIVVPEEAKHNLPKEIVFPTSYKTHYKRRELNYLIDIALDCEAKIDVLHVSEGKKLTKNQEEHKEMLTEIFEDVTHSFHELSINSLESAISIFVESRDADMVAFINKKHIFFHSKLTQPLVKELGFNSKVPVLVMHDLRN